MGTELAVTSPNLDVLHLAVEKGADIETIERLVKMQKDMADEAARREYASAMSRVQAGMRRISADATNPQTHSKYATYAALDREVRPMYSEAGFALSFDTGASEPDTVLVLCHVSHAGGHDKTYRALMPADGKGAKGNDVMTRTHATGAAMSYGMRYLLKMIFNVAIGEDDTDGNTIPSTHGKMSPEILAETLEVLNGTRSLEALRDVYEQGMTMAKRTKDIDAQKKILAAKDAKKKELTDAKP